jgi:hypothetical protein
MTGIQRDGVFATAYDRRTFDVSGVVMDVWLLPGKRKTIVLKVKLEGDTEFACFRPNGEPERSLAKGTRIHLWGSLYAKSCPANNQLDSMDCRWESVK